MSRDIKGFLGFFERMARGASRDARKGAEDLSRPRGVRSSGGMDGVPPLDAHVDGGHTGPARVSRNREHRFNRASGRFHGADGEFEEGSPPPDLDGSADRYRAKDGRFKKRSQDLYDEELEVAFHDLRRRG